MGLVDLRARVVDRHRGLATASWPDPHPDMASPREEEYSRVTDLEKYRIVHTGAQAWADELGLLPEVAAAALPDNSGFRLMSARPDTLPLFLVTREEPLPLLDICAGRPDVVLQTLPDCGCDACDSGSEDLLDAIDELIGAVVDGPLVVLHGDGRRAHWSPHGGSASGHTWLG